ncbi:MAG: MerR family transcriptional regulator [Chloroflexi bacterium]|nr:MerR family transcriptional regulator [Chloroflexota bacterium]
MKTAEAARSAGIKTSTIRFYERQGLIEAQSRSSAGYRQFTNEDVRRLKFIKRAQELGFSLAEIRRFLAFSNQRVPLNRDVVLVGWEKLDDLNRRIQALTRMRSALEGLLSNVCDISEAIECPIIHSLADFD